MWHSHVLAKSYVMQKVRQEQSSRNALREETTAEMAWNENNFRCMRRGLLSSCKLKFLVCYKAQFQRPSCTSLHNSLSCLKEENVRPMRGE